MIVCQSSSTEAGFVGFCDRAPGLLCGSESECDADAEQVLQILTFLRSVGCANRLADASLAALPLPPLPLWLPPAPWSAPLPKHRRCSAACRVGVTGTEHVAEAAAACAAALRREVTCSLAGRPPADGCGDVGAAAVAGRP